MGTTNGFHVARCGSCAHVFIIDLPDERRLEEVYRRYSYDTNDLKTISPVVFERLDQIVGTFDGIRKTNRLLDVGFGAGAVLATGQRRGWDVYGIELSALAVEQAHEHGFPNAIHGNFLTAPFEPASFDVVMMTELIEHLPHPLPYLEQAHRLLRTGGELYLTTPNGAGISGRILGTEWSVLAPPDHLNLFSPCSLRTALKRSPRRPPLPPR
jgi:2-polyprenyl-3-methyl-5-hydroxy-6-metoxy-1,4-benzoquinol methylase